VPLRKLFHIGQGDGAYNPSRTLRIQYSIIN